MELDYLCGALLLFMFAIPLSAQSLNATDELTQGVQALKRNSPADAVRHFKTAISLDDKFVDAHLNLAAALADEYIPGAEGIENIQLAEQAIVEYKRVIELSPENAKSIKSIAALLFTMKRLEESKQYYRMVIDLDPGDTESYYAIAVIDWSQAYTAKGELTASIGLEIGAPFIDRGECWTLRNENEERVTEGIEMLTKALDLRPAYDDAMAYLNLLYRQRADIQCGARAAYNADNATADKWVDRAMETRKARAEKDGLVQHSTRQKQ